LIRKRLGSVSSIVSRRPGLEEITVDIEGRPERAINYEYITGPVEAGDQVLLNTTAVSINLGTGGYHFVMAVLNRNGSDPGLEGHIMKLRYTPLQVKVLSSEEREQPAVSGCQSKVSLDGMPVIICSLHSMLAPVSAALRSRAGDGPKIVYLMTDGGSLPIWFSHLVHQLKEKGLVDETITCGHAFGGDYEAVNIYSGLIWARANGAGAVIAAMGPGVVGTATMFGNTAIEQGEIVNAVNVLGGRAIAVPRISFADSRPRHFGISHHTLTALGKIALTGCTMVIPPLGEKKKSVVEKQLLESGILLKHQVVEMDPGPVENILGAYGLSITTMGRDVSKDPEFFATACSAGLYTAELLKSGSDQGTDRNIC